MTALAAERNTIMKDGELIPVKMAAGAKIYAGGMVVANATGYGAPGSTALNLTYLGRAEETVDNAGGADGDKTVLVRRGKAFLWSNFSGDLVTQASLGKSCFIVDDQTVALTNGTSTRSAAGTVLEVTSEGVLVL